MADQQETAIELMRATLELLDHMTKVTRHHTAQLEEIHASIDEMMMEWQKIDEELQKGLEDRAENVVVLHPCDTEEPKGSA